MAISRKFFGRKRDIIHEVYKYLRIEFCMTISLSERLKLKKTLKKLNKFRARHTELVSVYISSGTEISKIIQNLTEEQGTATNIKDKNTSKSVISALERMIRTLKTYDKTPENGLAIFSGNISEKDNIQNFQVFVIEPPEPLNQKIYRCDQVFITSSLEKMIENSSTYALLVIDKGEATLGTLVGSSIKVIKHFNSQIPGKFKTGGQSAQRFARIREGAAIEFYKRVADVMVKKFTFMKDLKGIIVGGPGTTKNNFLDGNYLNNQIKEKVIGVKDITYTNAYGLKELFELSKDVLSNTEVMQEKEILEKFFSTLAHNSSIVTYGTDHTKKALEMASVSDLIIIYELLDEHTIEELSHLAQGTNAHLHLVTDKTPQGVQFKNLGGVGGILRFPI